MFGMGFVPVFDPTKKFSHADKVRFVRERGGVASVTGDMAFEIPQPSDDLWLVAYRSRPRPLTPDVLYLNRIWYGTHEPDAKVEHVVLAVKKPMSHRRIGDSTGIGGVGGSHLV